MSYQIKYQRRNPYQKENQLMELANNQTDKARDCPRNAIKANSPNQAIYRREVQPERRKPISGSIRGH